MNPQICTSGRLTSPQQSVTIYPGGVVAFQQATPQQLGINLGELLQPLITFMIVMLMMKVMMTVIKTPTSELTKLPERALEKLRGTPKPVEKPKVARAAVEEKTREEELEQKRLSLEATGNKMAKQAGKGIKFLRLDEGWQQRYTTVRFWFKDSEGNEIVVTDLEELKWKLSH